MFPIVFPLQPLHIVSFFCLRHRNKIVSLMIFGLLAKTSQFWLKTPLALAERARVRKCLHFVQLILATTGDGPQLEMGPRRQYFRSSVADHLKGSTSTRRRLASRQVHEGVSSREVVNNTSIEEGERQGAESGRQGVPIQGASSAAPHAA